MIDAKTENFPFLPQSPLTSSTSVRLEKSYKTADTVKAWQSWFGINIESEFGSTKAYYLFRCLETNLGFFQPSCIAGTEFLYSQLEQFDWYYGSSDWELTAGLNALKKHKCHRVLEVGSGSGRFLKMAMNAGIDAIGLELNTKSAAKSSLDGLNVKQRTLKDEAESSSEEFDAVCAFQVLEHPEDPLGFIKDCLKLLRPNGLLIFCVPNNDSYLKHHEGLLNQPPHHMTRWSKSTFLSLTQILPLQLMKCTEEPLARLHVPGYLRALRTKAISAGRIPGLLHRKIADPILSVILKTKLRIFFRGHGLLVVLKKK